jgi:hypothetical protein
MMEVLAVPEREVLTLRVPSQLLACARNVKTDDESMNDLIVTALEHEVRRREGLTALAAIDELREQIYARTGVQPSSVPLIRALREGDEPRD